MSDRFQDFCGDAERALADVLAQGHNPLIRLAHAHGAQWHPNGFAIFDFGSLGPGSLRLHIWPRGHRPMRDTSAHVHTHVWDLFSKILVGTYTERMYDVLTEPGDGSRVYRTARIDYLHDRNTLNESSSSHLRPIETVTATAGRFHSVRAGLAHETLIPVQMLVATLLIVSPARLDEALVYSETAFQASAHTRAALADDEKSALLDELREGLINEVTE